MRPGAVNVSGSGYPYAGVRAVRAGPGLPLGTTLVESFEARFLPNISFAAATEGGSPLKIARSIHRLGDRSIVNSYLVEEAGEVTIIDAGVPGFYRDIPEELAAMGRTVADVRALVLTHGHADHIGFAERLRRERAVPVSVHEADAALARSEVPNPSKGFGPVKLGPLLGFLWFSLLHGGLRTPKLHEVATFGDGATLDVPGR